MELDDSDEFKDANVQSIKFLATMMYNDCVITLNIDTYDESEQLYEKHKGVLMIIEPELDTRTKDIEYYECISQYIRSAI